METAGYIQEFLKQHPAQQHFQGFELKFRELVFQASAQLLQPIVQALVDQFDASFTAGPGQIFIERRPLEITGLFGPMSIVRDYYLEEGNGHCPADASLGLEGAYTPALARMICRSGAKSPFQEASQDLEEFAGVQVSDRQIQRLVRRIGPQVQPWLKTQQFKPESALMYVCGDGTGVPMRQEFLLGRKGKQPDGSAKTREAKLGCVFLQSAVDDQGHPVRQEASTSYIASFQGAACFGLLLRQEAQRRGMGLATKVIFIGDGAAWIWELARVNFPGAVLIVDFFHALEHVHSLVEAIWGKESVEGKKRIKRWKGWLLKDKVRQLIQEAKVHVAGSLDIQKTHSEIGYLENHQALMTYGTFRKAGYFIGSGVVEAGCKTVIGKRMKCSGMFWSHQGGQGMLDLRCALLSDRLDAFWKDRAASHIARNDPLKLAA